MLCYNTCIFTEGAEMTQCSD